MSIGSLRQAYHRRICKEIVRLKKDGKENYPDFADEGSKSSRVIATRILQLLDCAPGYENISGQIIGGDKFSTVTKDFLEATFGLLSHLFPGKWLFSTQMLISDFDQYEHLANLERIINRSGELTSDLGQVCITRPDIVIGRWPISDEEINQEEIVLTDDYPSVAVFTPFRKANLESPKPILHASISCKWTLRSDRGQNARTEALNLVRNRKGSLPHIVSVTAEPLPSRIASLALGTGDLDCVYHFALPELREAIEDVQNEDQMDTLSILIEGRRLRDISDLPFDLAV